jgi:hypothetical protein
MHPRRILSRAVLVATMLSAMSSAAADRSIVDLLGHWCGDISNYDFTRSKLTVTFHDGTAKRVWNIERVVGDPDWLDVHWANGNTVFHRFSKDGEQMFQAANTKGDMGPEREFHRC